MKTSILIIDDTKAIRQQILDTLKSAELFSDYYEAGDGIEGFKFLLAKEIDIVLCDLEMPGMDGFKFLRMVASREELFHIPVIMLTSHEHQDAKIKGLEAGACDYITKPFFPAELLARVKVQLKIKSLQDRLKESNRQLLELSQTDALTGLANRRRLMETLHIECDRSERKGDPLSLLMIDLDHFKRVNDTYGHQDGDVVLRCLAETLQAHLRKYDTAARFGGEEFCLALPQTPQDEAVAVAERLCAEIKKMRFTGSSCEIRITVSIGVATAPHKEIKDCEDLIRFADNALYRAKENGRNRVETAT